MSAASEKKMGEKAKMTYAFGALVFLAGPIMLAFGIRDVALLIAWLTALAAVPTQFSIANAAVTRKFAEINSQPQDTRGA